MGKVTIELTEQLYEYMLSVSLRDTALQRALRKHTDGLEQGVMQISADQGQFMALLLNLMQAKRVIKIGAHSLKSLERNILRFTGIGPIRESLIGSVEGSTRHRDHWLARLYKLGIAGR